MCVLSYALRWQLVKVIRVQSTSISVVVYGVLQRFVSLYVTSYFKRLFVACVHCATKKIFPLIFHIFFNAVLINCDMNLCSPIGARRMKTDLRPSDCYTTIRKSDVKQKKCVKMLFFFYLLSDASQSNIK